MSRREAESHGIAFYCDAWVSGWRVCAFLGNITGEAFFDDGDYDTAEEEVLGQLARATQILGGNTVLGWENTLDPFTEKGCHLRSVGTACVMERMF